MAACLHQGAIMADELGLADNVDSDHGVVDLRIKLEKVAADAVGTGVVDQETHFDVVGRGG